MYIYNNLAVGMLEQEEPINLISYTQINAKPVQIYS